jgi:hypothetical protein
MPDHRTELKLIIPGLNYKSGDEVKGKVVFRPAHKLDKVHLQVSGREAVAWVETMSYSVQGWNQTYIEEFKAENKLFYSSLELGFPTELDMDKTYTVDFSFFLPLNLPGSHTDNGGVGIVYRIQAFDSIDHVKSVFDLNVIQEPLVSNRISVKSKKPLTLCCKRGDILSRFTFDQASYKPGDTVLVTPVIVNKSKGTLKNYQLSLKSVVEMKCPEKSKKVENVIMTEQVQPSTQNDAFMFTIPDAIGQCSFGSIYNHYYVLNIHLDMSAGWGPSVEIPLFILLNPTSDSSSIYPIKEDQEAVDLPPVVVRIQNGPTRNVPTFNLNKFPNVSEIPKELGSVGSRFYKSASRLMQSFAR